MQPANLNWFNTFTLKHQLYKDRQYISIALVQYSGLVLNDFVKLSNGSDINASGKSWSPTQNL